MGRDPRVEPRAGDVLQSHSRITVSGRTPRWVVYTRKDLNFAMRLTQWKKQMRTATIIHAEGE